MSATKVLITGDSISTGYAPLAAAAPAGEFDACRSKGNGVPADAAAAAVRGHFGGAL